jgi:hypothetical protein
MFLSESIIFSDLSPKDLYAQMEIAVFPSFRDNFQKNGFAMVSMKGSQ